jgi:hypothetical protein
VKTYKEYTESPVNEVDSSGIDMYDNKRKESERKKKARETPSSPETQAKLKKVRAGETVDEYVGSVEYKKRMKKKGYPEHKKDRSSGYVEDIKKTFAEITTGLLNRAAGAAKKDAATQRDAQDWATRVKGKGHAFGAAEAGKKAAKREKQAGKFSAAADVKQRNTAFKKEGVMTGYVDELSKGLLQRAQQSAKAKAGQQRAVSAKAASRVGDTSQPPGQNLKSKRADFKAAKKDYQAFKFKKAADKKEEE